MNDTNFFLKTNLHTRKLYGSKEKKVFVSAGKFDCSIFIRFHQMHSQVTMTLPVVIKVRKLAFALSPYQSSSPSFQARSFPDLRHSSRWGRWKIQSHISQIFPDHCRRQLWSPPISFEHHPDSSSWDQWECVKLSPFCRNLISSTRCFRRNWTFCSQCRHNLVRRRCDDEGRKRSPEGACTRKAGGCAAWFFCSPREFELCGSPQQGKQQVKSGGTTSTLQTWSQSDLLCCLLCSKFSVHPNCSSERIFGVLVQFIQVRSTTGTFITGII